MFSDLHFLHILHGYPSLTGWLSCRMCKKCRLKKTLFFILCQPPPPPTATISPNHPSKATAHNVGQNISVPFRATSIARPVRSYPKSLGVATGRAIAATISTPATVERQARAMPTRCSSNGKQPTHGHQITSADRLPRHLAR